MSTLTPPLAHERLFRSEVVVVRLIGSLNRAVVFVDLGLDLPLVDYVVQVEVQTRLLGWRRDGLRLNVLCDFLARSFGQFNGERGQLDEV